MNIPYCDFKFRFMDRNRLGELGFISISYSLTLQDWEREQRREGLDSCIPFSTWDHHFPHPSCHQHS